MGIFGANMTPVLQLLGYGSGLEGGMGLLLLRGGEGGRNRIGDVI